MRRMVSTDHPSMRMSTVTVKPLSLELSWHLTGEAGRSKINFDCIIGGMEGAGAVGREAMLGFFAGHRRDDYSDESRAFPLYKWMHQGDGGDAGSSGWGLCCKIVVLCSCLHFSFQFSQK